MQTQTQPLSFEQITDNFRRDLNQVFSGNAAANQVLVRTEASGEDLWNIYLEGWPESERQGYNCNSCRSFVKNYGNLVILNEDKKVSIWRSLIASIPHAREMAEFAESKSISSYFFVESRKALLGNPSNLDLKRGHSWHHFSMQVPARFHRNPRSMSGYISEQNDLVQTLRRTFEEISTEAVEITAELIKQNSLKRAEHHLPAFKKLQELRTQFEALSSNAEAQSNFLWWAAGITNPGVIRLRSIDIGTALKNVQISLNEPEGSPKANLDWVVNAWLNLIDPSNYNRPQAVNVTVTSLTQLKKQLQDHGLLESLGRRHATADDIGTNYLWKNADVVTLQAPAEVSNPLDLLLDQTEKAKKVDPKAFAKVEQVAFADFLEKILPTATSVEVLVEPTLTPNMVSLVAPKNPDAPPLTKQDNNLSWSYLGGLATSPIVERAKKAGGKVDGAVTMTLSWDHPSDLDFHLYLKTPGKVSQHIYFNNKSALGGKLDVDKNVNSYEKDPVENISFGNLSHLKVGDRLVLEVNTFNYRSPHSYPNRDCKKEFQVRVQNGKNIWNWQFPNIPAEQSPVTVATFVVVDPAKNEISLVDSKLQPVMGDISSSELWSLPMNKFVPVSIICKSPNAWDKKPFGLEHIFFFLEGCENPEKVRGIFNEQIKPEILHSHKKAFEALGDMMLVEPVAAKTQLSGVGFSSVDTNEGKSITVRVNSGALTRVLKVVV